MLNDEPIRVTLLVVDALEKLGIEYVIGGSLASALHGVARATMDTDIVAITCLLNRNKRVCCQRRGYDSCETRMVSHG